MNALRAQGLLSEGQLGVWYQSVVHDDVYYRMDWVDGEGNFSWTEACQSTQEVAGRLPNQGVPAVFTDFEFKLRFVEIVAEAEEV